MATCKLRVVALSMLASAAFLSTVAPTAAHIGSGISGVVRDTSGAALPGVTVEAASPNAVQTVGTSLGRPSAIVMGRLARVGGRMTF